MKFKSSRRTGTVPVSLKTHHVSKSEIQIHVPGLLIPPLSPTVERELRRSCSAIFAAGHPVPSHLHAPTHTKTRSVPPNASLPVPVSPQNRDARYLYSPSTAGHSRGPSNPRTPRYIEDPQPPPASAVFPNHHYTDSTSSSATATPPTYAFAKTVTARQISISHAHDLGLQPPPSITIRKSSLPTPSLSPTITTIQPATATVHRLSSPNPAHHRIHTASPPLPQEAAKRASQVPLTLTRPTLVDVAPRSPCTPHLTRPKTSSNTPTSAHRPDWSGEFGKVSSAGVTGRLSLFPRPRTATGERSDAMSVCSSNNNMGGERPLPPLPPRFCNYGVGGKDVGVVTTEVAVKDGGDKGKEKEKDKKGGFRSLAFWKVLRFGGRKGHHHGAAVTQAVA